MIEFVYNSPVGGLLLRFEASDLTGLYFLEDDQIPKVNSVPQTTAHKQCVQELDEYFNGARQVFTVPMKLRGTPFRKRVWQSLCEIPYAKTCSYKDLAEMIGNVKAVRAVGGANHHNPVSIIVPCHRVVGSDGSLTGYGGKLWRKEWLLKHEANHSNY